MTFTLTKVLAVAAIALAALVGIQTVRLHAAQNNAKENALAATNAAAAADTTRFVAMLKDSSRVYQRQVLQLSQRADALDKQLGQTSSARAGVKLRVDTVRVFSSSRSTPTREDTTTGVRSATFDQRTAPYSIHAYVELPPPASTLPRVFDARVALDAIPLGVRLACSAKAGAEGIRVANLETIAPPWASIAIDSVTAAPEICNAKALTVKAGSHFRPQLSIGPGYGLQLEPGGTVRAGWTFSAQVSLFHFP